MPDPTSLVHSSGSGYARVRALVALSVALLALSVRAPGLPDPHIEGDPRLRAAVSMAGADLYVGEVVAELARQTGVSIKADESSGAADARLLIAVTDTPAWKVMEGVRRLYTYKQAPWIWERTRHGSEDGYRLVQTRAAQLLSDRLEGESQQAFEEDAIKRIEDAERIAAKMEHRLRDPAPVPIAELEPWGALIFARCVPADMQGKVLSGEQQYEVAADDLPGWARRFVEDTARSQEFYRHLPDGSRERMPTPTRIRVSADRLGPKATRSLYIDLEGIGGLAYFGGRTVEEGFRKRVHDLWLGQGELRADAALESARVGPVQREPASHQSSRIRDVLLEAAARSRTPILARLWHDTSSAPGAGMIPSHATLADVLARLSTDSSALQWKWWNKVLLVSYHSWFTRREELHRPRWRIVRQLRESAARPGGLVSLKAVLAAAAALTEQQFLVLAQDWRDALGLAAIRDVLAAVVRDERAHASLTSNGRAVLSGDVARRAAAARLPIGLSVAVVDRVVLTVAERAAGGGSVLDFRVMVLDGNGREIAGIGLALNPGAP